MGHVVSIHATATHSFSKALAHEITLLEGLGVMGDAHYGATVKHRSRVARDPSKPNLRQVHLIHAELLDELTTKGFNVKPGDLGENITTRGIDVLALPRGTELQIGTAVIHVTGLRNPCAQIENFAPGLLAAVLDRDQDNRLVRKAGVMAVVVTGGVVRVGDEISIRFPALPHERLEPV